MTAVFSAEYAAELVRRARDGASFYVVGVWYPVRCGSCNCLEYEDPDDYAEAAEDHWVEWYRETRAARVLVHDVYEDFACIDSVILCESYASAGVELYRLIKMFCDSLDALGSLVRV